MDSKFSRDEGSGLVDVRALAEQTLAARPKTEPKPDDHDLIPFSTLTAFPTVPLQPMLVPVAAKRTPGWVWAAVGGGVAAAVAVAVVLVVRPGTPVSTTEPQSGSATTTETSAKTVTAAAVAATGAQKAPDPTPTTAAVAGTKAADVTAADTKAADTKAADTKAADTKAADTKAADTKAADTKAADTKAADTKAAAATKAAATATADHAAARKEAKATEKAAAHEGDAKAAQTKTAAAAKSTETPAEKAPAREATAAVAAKDPTPAPATKKPPAGGDEDLRNLLGLDNETSKKPEPKAAAAANLPEQLSSGDIRSGMGSLKSKVDGCFALYKVPGTVLVSTTIGGDGKVQSAKASGALAGSQEADCVTTVVSGAHFKKFTGTPMSITYPFILR